MFHISTLSFSRSVATMLEVLELFRNDSHLAFVEASEVSLSHAGQPITVTKYNGRLTVRVAGSVRDLFLAMLDEIDGKYFRPNGRLLQPWQIRPAHWDLLFFAFLLSSEPLYLFSSDQMVAASDSAHPGRSISLFALCQSEATARFGFGSGGPVVPRSGQVNSRHEVHLAYALAAGEAVPEEVLHDYAGVAEPFGNDIRWARPLLKVPELRGAMPVEKLRNLVSVLMYSRKVISSENAALLAMVARLLPNEPTQIEVDDLLYRHGFLDAQSLPEAYNAPVDVGAPVSEFAAVLWRIMADERKAATLTRLELERADMKISQRYFDLHRQMAVLDHGRGSFDYANDFANAVETGDVGMLLSVVDRPDDQNRWTKMAIREFFGVKLLGIKAAARRRAIFALAGMDEAQQSAWEQESTEVRAARFANREAERAKARATAAQYRYGHRIVSGGEHVESSIASGFTEIVSYGSGASRRYGLKNSHGEGRKLRASDGTLAYAKALLSKQKQTA